MNQARASKINDSGYSACQRFFAEIPTDGRCHCGVRRSRSGGCEQAICRRTGTRTVEDCETSLALDHKCLWKRALHHAAKHCKGELHIGQPSRFGDVERMQPRNQQTLWSSATRWPHFGSPTAVSLVKCARSHVRPFLDDDEARETWETR